MAYGDAGTRFACLGRSDGGSFGLPADFLIASDGRLLASKYGVNADDQWSVDELLALVRVHARSEAKATA